MGDEERNPSSSLPRLDTTEKEYLASREANDKFGEIVPFAGLLDK